MNNTVPASSGSFLTPEGKMILPKTPNRVLSLLEGRDPFLCNLIKQPKFIIGNYMESLGIRVPTRYASFEEAHSSGKKFIARSEHPYEYSGISGLFDSAQSDEDGNIIFYHWKYGTTVCTSEQEALDYMTGKARDDDHFNNFCDMKGFDVEEFLSQLSFSYWEYIPGVNHKVIRDDVVSGRYHILSEYPEGIYDTQARFASSYYMIEKGEVRISHGSPLETNVLPEGMPACSIVKDKFGHHLGISANSIAELIHKYEAVNYAPSHNPVVEMQTAQDSQKYFLQSHRCRDNRLGAVVDLSDFDSSSYLQCDYVRGATGPEGIHFGINLGALVDTVWNPGYDKEKYQEMLGDSSITSYGLPQTTPDVVEYTGSRKVSIGYHRNINRFFYDITNAHEGISSVFKPEVYPLFELGDLFPNQKGLEGVLIRIYHADPLYVFPLHLVSDGRDAYIKAMKTWEELLSDGRERGVDIVIAE